MRTGGHVFIIIFDVFIKCSLSGNKAQLVEGILKHADGSVARTMERHDCLMILFDIL